MSGKPLGQPYAEAEVANYREALLMPWCRTIRGRRNWDSLPSLPSLRAVQVLLAPLPVALNRKYLMDDKTAPTEVAEFERVPREFGPRV